MKKPRTLEEVVDDEADDGTVEEGLLTGERLGVNLLLELGVLLIHLARQLDLVSLLVAAPSSCSAAAASPLPLTRTMSSVAPFPMPSTCQRSLRRSTNATSTRIHSRQTSSSGPSTPSSLLAPLRPLRNLNARMHSLRAPSVLPPPMPLRSPSDSHWLAMTQ